MTINEEYSTGDQPCPLCNGWGGGETVVLAFGSPVIYRRFHKTCLREQFQGDLL